MFINLANKKKISLFDSLEFSKQLKLRGKQQDSIENFHTSIKKFSSLLETLDPKELLRTLLEEFNIENNSNFPNYESDGEEYIVQRFIFEFNQNENQNILLSFFYKVKIHLEKYIFE